MNFCCVVWPYEHYTRSITTLNVALLWQRQVRSTGLRWYEGAKQAKAITNLFRSSSIVAQCFFFYAAVMISQSIYPTQFA